MPIRSNCDISRPAETGACISCTPHCVWTGLNSASIISISVASKVLVKHSSQVGVGAGVGIVPFPAVNGYNARLSLWSLNPLVSLSFPANCCPWWPVHNRRFCSRSCPGPAFGLRSFCPPRCLPWLRTWSSLSFYSSPAYDCIEAKVVPITNKEVMAAISKMFFVLFIVKIKLHFFV